ncbi:MAG: hypothetical protein OHK005_14510 [Candidatus Methylacidiphilales bacterium]
MKGSVVFIFFLTATSIAFSQAKPLQTAAITTVINDVRLAKTQAAPQPAAVGQTVLPNEGVITGAKSRAELVFSDKTLARLGANTQFTFIPGSRTTELNQGTILLQVPKGAGGAQVKTAAVTAAVTGTTILVEYFPNNFIKLIVLEGTLRVALTNRLGESLLLEAGKMLVIDPNANRLPDPVDIDIKKLVKTSKLIAGMGDPGELDFGLINEEIAHQDALKRKGRLLDTNILIAGSGTELVVVSEDILLAIQNAINAGTFTSSGSPGSGSSNPNPVNPNPPPTFATITDPNPFPLGPTSIVSTNPTITNGSAVYQGASRTASENTEDTTFIFGTTNTSQDIFLGGYELSPGTPFATFRFSNLDLLGSPIINAPTGVIHLALASEGALTFAPGTYTFSPLTSLFLGSVGPMVVPTSVSFNQSTLDLTLYARGPGSNLTFDGQATVNRLRLQAAGTLTFGNPATFSGSGLDLYALGDVFVQTGATASTFIDIVSVGAIYLNPEMLTPLSAPFIFLEQGPGAGTLSLNPWTLAPSNLLEARADSIFVEEFLPFSLRLFAGSGGISVNNPEGFISLFNLNVIETHDGGNLTAGSISFNNVGLGTISGDVNIEVFQRGDVPVTFTVGGNMSAFTLNFSSFDPEEAPDGGSLTLNIPNANFGISFIESFGFDGSSGDSAGGHGGTFTINATSITFEGLPPETQTTLNGGPALIEGDGGRGGTFTANASGAILMNGDITLSAVGGDGPNQGGDGGSLSLQSSSGSVTLESGVNLTVNGGQASNIDGVSGHAGTVTLAALTDLILDQATVEANGGDTPGQAAGNGGAIQLKANSSVSGHIQVAQSSLNTNGGSAYDGQPGNGGTITLESLRQLGTGITINNSSTLRALANVAAETGGLITIKTMGADINLANSTVESSGGLTPSEILVLIPETAAGGTINLANASLTADILRIGALAPNGSVVISNNSVLTATDTLKIYGGSSSGMVRFTGGGTITLTGGATANIRAHTVQIDPGTTVNNDGLASTNVDAVNHNYNISGYGDFTTPPTTGAAPDF